MHLQRYSFENNNSYTLLKPIEFIFKLNQSLWELVHKIIYEALLMKGTGVIKVFVNPRPKPVLDHSGKQELNQMGLPLWKSKMDILFDDTDDRIAQANKKRFQDDEGYMIWASEKEPQFYNNRGIDYYHKGEFDNAIEDFDKAIKLNTNYAEAYGNRGIAYGMKGELDNAIEDFNRSIEINPNRAEPYSNRGLAYNDKGEFDNAIEVYCHRKLGPPPKPRLCYNTILLKGVFRWRNENEEPSPPSLKPKLCLRHFAVKVPKQNCVVDTTSAKINSQSGSSTSLKMPSLYLPQRISNRARMPNVSLTLNTSLGEWRWRWTSKKKH